MSDSTLVAGAVVLVATAAALLVVVRRGVRRRRLSAADAASLRAEFALLDSIPDDARRVLEAEKILDHAFASLGYRGTFADKLRQAGPRLGGVQAVWDAHKLRNRIAHERSVTVDRAQARRALAAFERALRDVSL